MRLISALMLMMSVTACGRRVMPGEGTFLVRDVRLFDGEVVTEHRSVLVQDGVIARIGGAELAAPRGIPVIDGRGHTLLPGLIDAHVHLSDSAEADLRQAVSLGVTTVLDMWSGSTRYDRIKQIRSADAPGLAGVRTAGIGATAPGGHPSQMGGPPFPTITDPAEAAAFVDARIGEGSDYLKIVYDDLGALGMSAPMLDRPTLTALVAAAHARGKLAVVHVMSAEQARAAVEAGADGLAHLFTEPHASPGFADLAASRGAFVTPTLSVVYAGLCGRPTGQRVANDPLLRPYIRPSLREWMSDPPSPTGRAGSCEGTKAAIRQLAERGVPILAGSDAPGLGLTYGASLLGELELLVDLGLTPVQALTAATAAPARSFGLTDRGAIRRGLRADLVMVEGNPTTDILATRRIAMVWKRGIRVERTRYEE